MYCSVSIVLGSILTFWEWSKKTAELFCGFGRDVYDSWYNEEILDEFKVALEKDAEAQERLAEELKKLRDEFGFGTFYRQLLNTVAKYGGVLKIVVIDPACSLLKWFSDTEFPSASICETAKSGAKDGGENVFHRLWQLFNIARDVSDFYDIMAEPKLAHRLKKIADELERDLKVE